MDDVARDCLQSLTMELIDPTFWPDNIMLLLSIGKNCYNLLIGVDDYKQFHPRNFTSLDNHIIGGNNVKRGL